MTEYARIMTNTISVILGIILGAVMPFILLALQFNPSKVFSVGSFISAKLNLPTTLTFYTSQEIIGINSVLLTILIYAIVFSIILLGLKFLLSHSS